jgi:hypothetical protein
MTHDVMVIVAVMWSRRRGSGARYGANAPADRRTDTGTMPAARDRSDHGSGAGADQAAANRPLGGIVRVREGGRRQQQPGAEYAGNSRFPSHSLNSRCC